MSKPRIYATCKAGCEWETVHKDDFVKSASIIAQARNEDGSFYLEAGKKYKIAKSGESDTHWGFSIKVRYSAESAGGSPTSADIAVTLPNCDKYDEYVTFKCLDVYYSPLTDHTVCDVVIVVEVNGERSTYYANVQILNPDHLQIERITVVGSSKCYLINEDATIETKDGDSVFVRYSANADGTDFTKEWSAGKNYIGIATGQTAPTEKSGYIWALFGGALANANVVQTAGDSVAAVMSQKSVTDELYDAEDIDLSQYGLKIGIVYNGAVGGNTRRCCTNDLIEIPANHLFYYNVVDGYKTQIVYYDASKVYLVDAFVDEWITASGLFSVPKNAKYCRLNVSTINNDLVESADAFINKVSLKFYNPKIIDYRNEIDLLRSRLYQSSNAVKGAAFGLKIVNLTDASPVEHIVKVKAQKAEWFDPANKSVFATRKNLIPFPYTDLGGGTTKGGITATVQEDGGVCFNGTSTGEIWFNLTTINIGNGTIAPTSAGGFIANGEYSTEELMNGATPKWKTFYSPSDNSVSIVLSAGTYENYVVYPQIEVGYASTDYVIGADTSYAVFDENQEAELKSVSANEMTIVSPFSDCYFGVTYNVDINIALKPRIYEGYGLPVLYFDGDISTMTKDTEVTLAYVYGERSGTCKMKWQGTSSIGWPKKNYTVKFDNAFEAAEGWGEQKKYCLKANYIDFSHIRNVCSAKLWGKIVKSRTTPNTKLNTLVNGGAVDGFPVCVVINNEYVGLYTFNIPKDGWMLGMGSGTQEAIVSAEGGDYLANRFKGTSDTFNGAFDIEYVTNENSTAWVEASLNRLIQACVDSDGTDLDTTIAQYLDWDSAIDYFILSCALGHFDGTYKNYLLSTYDGVKWFFTAYDMDSVFGNQWTGDSVYSALGFAPSYFTTYNRLFELIYKYKLNEVKARLATLTKEDGALHEEEVIKLYSNYSAKIPKALLDEDCKIWKTIPGTTYNNLGQIIAWYSRRFVYLKQWFG